ncbi:hypothetical protein [Candidatus Phytoplasma australiense]
MDSVSDIIAETDFNNTQHQYIFKAMQGDDFFRKIFIEKFEKLFLVLKFF